MTSTQNPSASWRDVTVYRVDCLGVKVSLLRKYGVQFRKGSPWRGLIGCGPETEGVLVNVYPVTFW